MPNRAGVTPHGSAHHRRHFPRWLVEGNWGLGESVVSGEITPDNFIIDKASTERCRSTINGQKPKMVVLQRPRERLPPTCLRTNLNKPARVWRKRELEEIVRIAKDGGVSFRQRPRIWNGSWINDLLISRTTSFGFKQGRPSMQKKAERIGISGGAHDPRIQDVTLLNSRGAVAVRYVSVKE